MSLKRKKEESFEEGPTSVTYASEVEWLKCLFHKTSASYAGTRESEAGSKHVIQGCKLVYILYHDIEAYDCLESLIQFLHRSAERNSKISLMREARIKQSGWKGQILNKFFLPHVKELKRKWEVAHPYAAFASLPDKERVRLWMEAYDAEPKSMIAKMFKPVIMALDLNSVFRLDLIGEDKRRMDAVRAMLRQKYWFGCHFTYKHNVAVEKKGKLIDEWAKYAQIDNYKSSIVPIADVPVPPGFSDTGLLPKKMKRSMAHEGDQLSLPAVAEGTALSLSSSPASTSHPAHDVTKRSVSLSQTSTMVSPPALERQNIHMKHTASNDDPIGQPLPSEDASSLKTSKPSILAGFWAGRELKSSLPSEKEDKATKESKVNDAYL